MVQHDFDCPGKTRLQGLFGVACREYPSYPLYLAVRLLTHLLFDQLRNVVIDSVFPLSDLIIGYLETL